jgi:hypothetical protein
MEAARSSVALVSTPPHHEGVLGVEVELHTFSSSVLDGSEWSASRPGRFTPREKDPNTYV